MRPFWRFTLRNVVSSQRNVKKIRALPAVQPVIYDSVYALIKYWTQEATLQPMNDERKCDMSGADMSPTDESVMQQRPVSGLTHLLGWSSTGGCPASGGNLDLGPYRKV